MERLREQYKRRNARQQIDRVRWKGYFEGASLSTTSDQIQKYILALFHSQIQWEVAATRMVEMHLWRYYSRSNVKNNVKFNVFIQIQIEFISFACLQIEDVLEYITETRQKVLKKLQSEIEKRPKPPEVCLFC